jgi:hypothetical protein
LFPRITGTRFDPAALHQFHDVFEAGVLVDGVHRGGHHLGNLAAMRVGIFFGHFARSHEELEPA